MDIFLGIIISLVVIFYLWYVSIIGKRNKGLESLSGIDVQLKKRSNLIPNILKIAQKFLQHEKSLITEITELREQTDKGYDKTDKNAVQQHLQVSELLSGKMGQLMVRVEDYPDLKSDQTMIQAMQTYNEVEAQIAAAMSYDALLANTGPLNNLIHEVRGFSGSVKSACSLRKNLKNGDLINKVIKTKVQDAYSLRSTHQVIG